MSQISKTILGVNREFHESILHPPSLLYCSLNLEWNDCCCKSETTIVFNCIIRAWLPVSITELHLFLTLLLFFIKFLQSEDLVFEWISLTLSKQKLINKTFPIYPQVLGPRNYWIFYLKWFFAFDAQFHSSSFSQYFLFFIVTSW